MKSSFFKQTGQKVRTLRRRHHCTQDELSRLLRFQRAPISREILANWESGRTEVPAHWIPLIAYVLRAKVTHILPDLTLKEIAGRIGAGPRRRKE